MESISELVVSLISSLKTSYEAWEKLNNMFANRFGSRVMYCKDRLIVPRGTRTIIEYVQFLKAVTDKKRENEECVIGVIKDMFGRCGT